MQGEAPIFMLTGTPGVGKTTLARTLMSHFERGLAIPVDDLREWVVSGLASPSPWTEETSRQFVLAEQSAVDLALRYSSANFATAIDHCNSLHIFDELVAKRLAGCNVVRVLLHASLETTLERNRLRTNKGFDTSLLDGVIQYLHPIFEREMEAERQKQHTDWLIIDTEGLTPDETCSRILNCA